MLTKCLGSALLLIAAYAVGRALASTAEGACRQAGALLLFFEDMQREIDSFCTPFRAILEKSEPALLGACGFPEDAARAPSVAYLLENATWQLSPSLRGRLLVAARGMGEGTRRDQLSACAAAISLLTPVAKALREELPARQRSSMTLSLAMAGTLILMLL